MPLKLVLVLLLPWAVSGRCPFAERHGESPIPSGHIPVEMPQGYREALDSLDLDAVKKDIIKVLTTSSEDWPSDYGDYAPFMIRLAWHCSGSYRTSDGRGGCDGGRQRFDPERSWDDNTNLDKARALLWPIKEKYGIGLSWGDLIVLAGTTAIEHMNGPILGFCAGRIDDPDGKESLALGPTPEQEALYPCPVNGECEEPLGTSTIGLIYVNPEGPMGEPKPDVSAGQVRDTFARMAMNDSETVALIGGGHSFGKAHGACPAGPGPNPSEDPLNPWPGECGSGKGADTFTSGFEGPWTTNPTDWDNSYFQNLLQYDWVVHKGPGGHFQWRTSQKSPTAPSADGNGRQDIMMMTTDVSLLNDPTGSYQQLVREYAGDLEAFDDAFAHAWYKLTTRDMGPVSRCSGDLTPPVQDWQYPLPPSPAPEDLANFSEVKTAIQKILGEVEEDRECASPQGWPFQCWDGGLGLFARLAFRCSATFRQTDYLGGCNGARIRFSPETEWPANEGLDRALDLLEPIKTTYGDALSYADLIVLSGTQAIENAVSASSMSLKLPSDLSFCPGRTDAVRPDGGSDYLAPKLTGNITDTIEMLRDSIQISGLDSREFLALVGGAQSLGQLSPELYQQPILGNQYFKTLLGNHWQQYTEPATGNIQFRAQENKSVTMLKADLLIRTDAELLAIAQDFASDNDVFLTEFLDAWVKLANADRFEVPC